MERKEVIIIGAGPAGLSAAIYTARAGLDTLILGCEPKIAGDYDIDNYFGFEETITGKDLIERGRKQAARFGAAIECERVLSIYHNDDGTFHVKTEQRELDTCALILATGVSRARPGIKNIEDYDGKGVSYCVSCDGFFYKGKKVAVLGEAIFAANQAIELTNYTQDVVVVTQGKKPAMTAEFEQRLADLGIPILERKIAHLQGDPGLESVVFEDGETMKLDGLFIAMGEASSMDFAYSLGLERSGVFVKADEEQRTNISGVYAAGDCIGGFLQIAVAVGEGAKAARAAISHVKKACR